MTKDPVIENRPLLLLEDDEDLGEIVSQRLCSEGYTVTWLKTWKEGQAYLEKESPDVLILDLTLPDADGMEILLQLNQNPRTENIAVIITSARDDTSDMVRGIQAGVLFFMTKPYELETLVKKVRSAVFQRFEMPFGNLPLHLD